MLSSVDYEKILHFISVIQDKDTVNIKNWRFEVLKAFSTTFGYEFMSFFRVDEKEHFSDPAKINVSDKFSDIYIDYLYKSDIFHTCNLPRHLLFKNIILVTDVIDYSEFEKTVFYNEFLRKQNLHYELAVPLSIGTQVLGAIGILKPKEMGDFTEKDLLLLNRLNKHIALSYKKQLDLALTKREQLIYKLCSHQSPVGLILADSKFTVIQHNEIALELCLEIIDESGGQLYPVQEIADQILLSYGELSQISNLQGTYKSCSFKIIPIISKVGHAVETMYAIYITKSSSKSRDSLVKINELCHHYNLTKREVEIADLILKGYNNKQELCS